MWKEAKAIAAAKLKTVDNQLRGMGIYGSPEKTQKKKRNYALKKVEEPPSDN